MNLFTSELNPAQADAVETLSGPLLILAGALPVLIMPTAALPLSRRTDKLPQTQTMGVVQGPVRADGSTTASTQEEDGYAVGRPSDGAEAQDAPEVRTALYVPPHERALDTADGAGRSAQGVHVAQGGPHESPRESAAPCEGDRTQAQVVCLLRVRTRNEVSEGPVVRASDHSSKGS